MLSAQAAAVYLVLDRMRRLGTNEKRDQPAILMPSSDQKAALFFSLG
jgi:hypothetical protein